MNTQQSTRDNQHRTAPPGDLRSERQQDLADRYFDRRKQFHEKTVHAQMLDVLRGKRLTVGVVCNKAIMQLTKIGLSERIKEDIDVDRGSNDIAAAFDWECKSAWHAYAEELVDALALETADFLATVDLDDVMRGEL